MSYKLPRKDLLGYFCMGLVTGLVNKQALVAWAERKILDEAVPGEDLIELSLSFRLPFSQVVRLLTHYQGQARYDLPLKRLFSQTGLLPEQDEQLALRIIKGLRLLIEEEPLDTELKSHLSHLEEKARAYRHGETTYASLYDLLKQFLEPYQQYRPRLDKLNDPSAPDLD